jgi:hypothetical protein
MITVGTPGLGVRHPDGKPSGWKIVNGAPSRIGPMRVADAQTGNVLKKSNLRYGYEYLYIFISRFLWP